MSKRLNTTEFVLDENEHFNYISVNINQSTVHVPTNVYEQCNASHHFYITKIALCFEPIFSVCSAFCTPETTNFLQLHTNNVTDYRYVFKVQNMVRLMRG